MGSDTATLYRSVTGGSKWGLILVSYRGKQVGTHTGQLQGEQVGAHTGQLQGGASEDSYQSVTGGSKWGLLVEGQFAV